MRELIQEHTGAAIGIAAAIALIALIGFLAAQDGPVWNAFVNMINAALQKAGASVVIP